MKGSDYLCSYPCQILVWLYHLTYVIYTV
jgi:hypothetical protein